MSAVKKLMAVIRIVPTPMDHTLAAVILATALPVMHTLAMVLIIIQLYVGLIFIMNYRY